VNTLVFAPVTIIIISAVLSSIIGRKSIKGRNLTIFTAFIIALSINTYTLILSLNGVFTSARFGELAVNAASIFISELVLFLGLLGALYSFRYIEERRESWLYYILYQLFIITMIGMASSFNILVIYIFLEASSVTSAILVMFSRKKSSIRAAYRYLGLSIFGGVIIIVGIIWQYQIIHTLDIAQLSNIVQTDLNLLATIYLLGFGIKAGLLPFGLLWLPSAHSEGPVPICALLSASLVQIAAFAIARILGNIGIVNVYISNMLLIVGFASMLIGSLFALIEAWLGSSYTRFHVGLRHICGIKRVLAFSTISEVGFIMVFLGLAGILTVNTGMGQEALILGFGGALIHMINHGLSKSQLFFDSGVIIKKSHAEDLNMIGGLSKRLPIMKISFTFGALTLGLIPGTFGVITLREIIFNTNIPDFTKIIVISTIGMTLIAILSIWYRSFFSKSIHEDINNVKVPTSMQIPGLILGTIILILGIVFTLEWAEIISFGPAFNNSLQLLVESMIKLNVGM
jgi:formate hydrogenlyase subunit 3/multisubunit Na+/H+ antiporter MnhD subunit